MGVKFVGTDARQRISADPLYLYVTQEPTPGAPAISSEALAAITLSVKHDRRLGTVDDRRLIGHGHGVCKGQGIPFIMPT